jgi:hypothetical protein
MAFPKQVKPFTCQFLNVGAPNEALRVSWTHPFGISDHFDFLVGSTCFYEDPSSSGSLALVPDEHFIASLSMMSILAGGLLIGTNEFKAAFQAQDTPYFQMAVGLVKLKDDPVLVGTTVTPEGLANLYNVTFYRNGQVNNTKTVEIDTFTGSQYSNRVDSCPHAVYCVAGAIFKQFPTMKKSNLGAADSQNRQDVIDWLPTKEFWV